MGRTIDERVVQLKFEGGQFERGISKSIRSMNELKKGMDFDDAVKGFEKLDESAKSLDMSHLSNSLDTVRMKFNLLDVMAFRVLDRIANKAIDTGTRMVRGLSIDQVSQGWIKFGDKTGAVQTIMSATAKQFTDTGEQMAYVNEQLDKLNWFTDETSYNFVDMVNNIGKFTSNNIELDKSVTAMQGIANWAAISGANANEASRAMYNISQALSSGAVRLEDWMSIENANMGTAAFKELAMQMALTVGTLKKQGDKIVTINKGVEVSVEKFRNTLTEDAWLNKDVLMATLTQYGQATNKLNNYIQELWDSGSNLLTSDLVTGIDAYVTGAKTAEEISKEWGLSLEKTSEILEDFNNETDKFGLQAFKAAQEAKTFEDAINSVKDAVSTGWMKSFEIIFGDYLEAKEFFTDLANVLYDIFAGGTEFRNEQLQIWKDSEGREMMIDTIWNAFASLLLILRPIQEAWKDIFGELTGKRILAITEAVWKFSKSLIELQKNSANNLQRTFRGLFAVLDMLRMLISGGFKIALSVVQEIFGEFNVDVLEFTGNIGDSLVALRDWMKEGNRFENVVNSIIGSIKLTISNIRAFINSIKNWGPVKSTLNAIKGVFNENFHGLDSIIQFTMYMVKHLWALISSVPKMTSLDELGDSFKTFGKNVIDSLADVGISLEGLKDLGDKVFGGLVKLFDIITGGFDDAMMSAGASFKVMQEIFNKIDWDGVIIMAAGVSILALAWKIADSISVFADAFSGITDIMESIKGMTDSVKDYFDALRKNLQANNIVKIAVAIGILVGSFYLLAKLDAKALMVAAGALVTITLAISAVYLVMARANKNKLDKSSANQFAMTVIAFAAAVYLIGKALNNINLEEIVPRLTILGTIMGSILAVTFVMSKGTAVARAIPGIMTYVGLALAITLLVRALKKISKLGAEDLFNALPVMTGLALVIAAFIRLSSRGYIIGNNQKVKALSSLGSALSIAIAMHILIGAIKKLGRMDPETLVVGLVAIGVIFNQLGILMYKSIMAGKYAKEAGKMLLYISIALNLIPPAINKLGKLDPKVAFKGLLVIEVLTQIMKQLMKASQETGDNAAKAGLLIIAVAGALMAIQLVVKTLGKIDLRTAIQGTAMVSVIILALAKMLKDAGGEFSEESIKSFTKLTIIIGILSALLLALSFMRPERALAAATSISAVLLALGYSIKLMHNMQLPNFKDMIKLYTIVGILGGIIFVLAKFTDPKSVIAVTSALSEILLAIGAAGVIMKHGTMPTVKEAAAWGVMVGAIGAIVAGLTLVYSKTKTYSIKALLSMTTGISEILISVGLASRAMGNQNVPSASSTRAMLPWIISVGALVAALALVASKIDGNVESVLYLSTAISEIMVALGIAGRIIGENSANLNINLKTMGGIAAAVGIMGLVIAAFSGMTDPVSVVPLASGLGVLLLAMAATLKILNGIQENSGGDLGLKVGMLAILAVIATLLGSVVSVVSSIADPTGAVAVSAGVSILMLALAETMKIISKIPPMSVTSAIKVLGLMLILAGVMGGLTYLLGRLCQDSNFKTVIADGGDAMILFGRAIGGFFGGIVGGFAEGVISILPALGASLSGFMDKAQGFFSGVEHVPPGLGRSVAGIAGALMALGAAGVITAITNLLSFILGGGADLGTTFSTFGEALKTFGESLGEDFDADKVQKAAIAGKALADLESNLPRRGGVLDAWLGSKDLEQFGARLEEFGGAITRFSVTVANVDPNVVKRAADAGMTIAKLENSLPAQGGKLQKFLGEQKLDDFGDRLEDFGEAIVKFANTTRGITADSVVGAKEAGDLLVALESSIPRQGGFLQTWIGSQSLDDFGDRLGKLGEGLADFSFNVLGVNSYAILQACTALSYLIELENNVKTTGGWGEIFTGKSNFGSFGENLKDLGSGLKSYYDSINKITIERLSDVTSVLEDLINIAKNSDVVFERITKMGAAIKDYAPSIGVWSSNASSADTAAMSSVNDELNRLLRMSQLTSATEWIKDITTHVSNMISSIINTIRDKENQLRLVGSKISYWLIKGFESGEMFYEHIAKSAATRLANRIKDTVEEVLEIASPSAVMREDGVWVVKGLAEGITAETSAEEAAQKKAQNIVSSFEKVLETVNLMANQRQLKFDIWGLTEGLTATETEKQQKEIELKGETLADAAKNVQVQTAAFETAKQTFGEGTKEYIEAENRMLTAIKEMYTIRNEITEMESSLLATLGQNDIRSQNDAYISWIKENEAAYKMLGYITDDNKDRLIQDAKEATGFGMDQPAKYTPIDVQSIVDSAFSEQSVTIMKEQIQKRVSGAVRSGVSAGLSNGISAETGGLNNSDSIAKGVTEAVKNAVKDKVPQNIYNGLENIDFAQSGGWLDQAENTVKNVVDGAVNAGKRYIPPATKTIGELFGGGMIEETNRAAGVHSPSEYTYETGMYLVQGMVNGIRDYTPNSNNQAYIMGTSTIDGLTKGINERGQQAIVAAKAVADAVAAQMRRALQVHSPSRITRAIGNYVDMGLAIGLRENIGNVEAASQEVANSTLMALDYMKDQINTIVESDDDFAPTITPVLNLDDLKKQGKDISRSFGRTSIDLQGARLQVGSIADQTAYGQNGSNKGGAQTNYNFTQNNYSPKALSRTEIYRQTRNEFARLKGASQR